MDTINKVSRFFFVPLQHEEKVIADIADIGLPVRRAAHIPWRSRHRREFTCDSAKGAP